MGEVVCLHVVTEDTGICECGQYYDPEYLDAAIEREQRAEIIPQGGADQ